VRSRLFLCLALSTQHATAQQNLFNVPSGKVTDLGELFFQEQFNFSGSVGTSNSTFDVAWSRV